MLQPTTDPHLRRIFEHLIAGAPPAVAAVAVRPANKPVAPLPPLGLQPTPTNPQPTRIAPLREMANRLLNEQQHQPATASNALAESAAADQLPLTVRNKSDLPSLLPMQPTPTAANPGRVNPLKEMAARLYSEREQQRGALTDTDRDNLPSLAGVVRPRIAPGQPVTTDFGAPRTSLERAIDNAEMYRQMKPEDLDQKKDNLGKNILKALGAAGQLWLKQGAPGGKYGGIGALLMGLGMQGAEGGHFDERMQIENYRQQADNEVARQMKTEDELAQLDARRAQTEFVRQRPIIEAEKEAGRNSRAEIVSADRAASRAQAKEIFDKRLDAQKERWKQVDSMVRYIESADGRGFLIDRYGNRKPAIDDATGKQFVNPYKQPYEVDFGDGEKMTVTQSQAAMMKNQRVVAEARDNFADAMDEYERTNNNTAIEAAVNAKRSEIGAYEGNLSGLRASIVELYDQRNDAAQRLESLRDRPDDDPDKRSAQQAFSRAARAVTNNEKETREFEEKLARANADITALQGKIKATPPPQRQTPGVRVNPRANNNNRSKGGYTSSDIERIIRQ
jgi:hypothetical protein